MKEQECAPRCEGCHSDRVWTVDTEQSIYLCKECSDFREEGLTPLFSVKVPSGAEARALIAGVMAASTVAGSEWAWRQWGVNGEWVVTVWTNGEAGESLIESDTVSDLYEYACQE